jgi:hypothetical protein
MASMTGPNGLATNSGMTDASLTILFPELLQLVLLLLWTCLNITPQRQRHQAFTAVLSSQIIIEELLSSMSLVFAPGLFDIVQALHHQLSPISKRFPPIPLKNGVSTSSFWKNSIVAQGFTLAQVPMPGVVSPHVFTNTTQVTFSPYISDNL